jgi:hypothetical protein
MGVLEVLFGQQVPDLLFQFGPCESLDLEDAQERKGNIPWVSPDRFVQLHPKTGAEDPPPIL